MAETPSASSRGGCGRYRLCDEQLFDRRLGGTLRGSTLQQSLSVLAVSCLAHASRAGAEFTMADAGNCDSSRHRNHPPGDGHILCRQRDYPSFTAAVFWYRVLDRVFDQHTERRAFGFDHGEGNLKSKRWQCVRRHSRYQAVPSNRGDSTLRTLTFSLRLVAIIGHPGAIQFLRISRKRVFQQPRVVTTG